jgi:cytochrome c oxidase cbb3-type subunit 3
VSRLHAPSLCALLLACAACKREERDLQPEPSVAEPIAWTRETEFQAGEGAPVSSAGDAAYAIDLAEYEANAHSMQEGKRLWSSFNCGGCHGQGGGGMGPALMDDRWIYGHEPEQIFTTIVEGRANGMPSFGGRIAAYQAWQLAAYVRSMSGLAAPDARPGRDDDMSGTPPENSRDREQPKPAEKPR